MYSLETLHLVGDVQSSVGVHKILGKHCYQIAETANIVDLTTIGLGLDWKSAALLMLPIWYLIMMLNCCKCVPVCVVWHS